MKEVLVMNLWLLCSFLKINVATLSGVARGGALGARAPPLAREKLIAFSLLTYLEF